MNLLKIFRYLSGRIIQASTFFISVAGTNYSCEKRTSSSIQYFIEFVFHELSSWESFKVFLPVCHVILKVVTLALSNFLHFEGMPQFAYSTLTVFCYFSVSPNKMSPTCNSVFLLSRKMYPTERYIPRTIHRHVTNNVDKNNRIHRKDASKFEGTTALLASTECVRGMALGSVHW